MSREICKKCKYRPEYEYGHCYPPIENMSEVVEKFSTPYQEALCSLQDYKYFEERTNE